MTYPTLQRHSVSDAVKPLQSLLNRIGAMLTVDGDFGPGTERGVRFAQKAANQNITGIADGELWQWLETQPEPFERLDTDGIAFIAREETGGLAFYERFTRWPHYPGHASGITIGVGYDLRFHSLDAFQNDWGELLSQEVLDELSNDIGHKGNRQRTNELKELEINIPFTAAWQVFSSHTIPNFFAQTESIYHSITELPKPLRSVLVSLVYNRGTSLSGSRRREMRNIQQILREAENPGLSTSERKATLNRVEDEILSMQRLWSTSSGLNKRRQAEANMWRQALHQWQEV